MNEQEKERAILLSRLRDMVDDVSNGRVRVGRFLTLAQQQAVRIALRNYPGQNGCFFGGYPDAERTRLYLFPDYLPYAESEGDPENYLRFCGYDAQTGILKIRGSGYRVLSHRDYMGALLNLGIERDSLGDIIVVDDRSAYVVCDMAILPFVSRELTKVANDAVTVTEEGFPDGWKPEKRFVPIRDTVPSARLDAMVACFCGLSREEAKKAVSAGWCSVNSEETDKADRELREGDVLSVRGQGKYRIVAFDGKNSRGRIRVRAEKYK